MSKGTGKGKRASRGEPMSKSGRTQAPKAMDVEARLNLVARLCRATTDAAQLADMVNSEQAARDAKAAELAMQQGRSFRPPKRRGATAKTIREDLKELSRRWQADTSDQTMFRKALEEKRLESLHSAWWTDAVGARRKKTADGKLTDQLEPASDGAARVVLDVHKAKAKLYGWDKAENHEAQRQLEFFEAALIASVEEVFANHRDLGLAFLRRFHELAEAGPDGLIQAGPSKVLTIEAEA